MELSRILIAVGLAYLLGAVPFGFILVMWTTGKDIRDVQSGRTGGTNAMRAAGFWVGLTTAILDILKGYVAVKIAEIIMDVPSAAALLELPNRDPWAAWVIALAPVAAILGHNYSISMIKVDKDGKIRLGGGAGGGTVLGGAMGLWPGSFLIMFPIAVLIYYFVGYASITTISGGVMAILIFAYRAYVGASPWEYVLFGVLATLLILVALQPNLKALRAGTERLHGYRARKQKKASRTG